MRVLLINPPQSGIFSEGLQPLGIAMLGAVLERKRHDVRIKDYTVEQYSDENLSEELRRNNADVIGISITTPVADFVYNKMVNVIRTNSEGMIIAGGPHPTILVEEALEYVDVVVRAEGEETIGALLENLNTLENVNGISYINNNKVSHNPAQNLIENLDILPFPARNLLPDIESYSGLPSLKQKRVYNISTSRGCPYHCIFCYQGVFGRRFRARSPENVLEEWELLIRKRKAEVITISDDTFTTDPVRVEQICRGIIQKKLKIPWTCSNGIRIGRDTAELLPLMKKAGCIHVAFGIESGNEESLKRINKEISSELIRKTVFRARTSGINTVVGFFIIGFPWENKKAILDTIEFACSLPLDYAHFTVPIPFPGTELYDLYLKSQQKIPPYNCFYPHLKFIFFKGKGLNKDEIKSLYRHAYHCFYFRPGILINHFSRAISSLKLLKRYLNEIFHFFV